MQPLLEVAILPNATSTGSRHPTNATSKNASIHCLSITTPSPHHHHTIPHLHLPLPLAQNRIEAHNYHLLLPHNLPTPPCRDWDPERGLSTGSRLAVSALQRL